MPGASFGEACAAAGGPWRRGGRQPVQAAGGGDGRHRGACSGPAGGCHGGRGAAAAAAAHHPAPARAAASVVLRQRHHLGLDCAFARMSSSRTVFLNTLSSVLKLERKPVQAQGLAVPSIQRAGLYVKNEAQRTVWGRCRSCTGPVPHDDPRGVGSWESYVSTSRMQGVYHQCKELERALSRGRRVTLELFRDGFPPTDPARDEDTLYILMTAHMVRPGRHPAQHRKESS